jgi:phytoene dehydrogenase-like protein
VRPETLASTSKTPPDVIVGAGISGLACAAALVAAGRRPVVLEASDGVGGRLRTDLVQGFRLDRGFAVLFEAYPEARAQLDLQALDLRPFEPGADVYLGGGRMVTLADPLRAPRSVLESVRSGIWRPRDLPALVRWRRRARPRLEATEHEMTADRRLRDLGLSEPLRERFMRPLFAGEFFDHDLRLSSLLLDQAFLMMARGATSLPSEGMGAIAEQLAGRIPGGVRLGARVQRVFDGGVELAGGEPIAARAVVVATEPPEAARLTGADLPREPRSTTALWFAAGRAPAGSRIVLDGTGEGPVTTVAAISEVAPSYAPQGSHLVCATCVGLPHEGDDSGLERVARAQLRDWFGADVDGWRLLRLDRIPWAQHAQPPGTPAQRPVRVGPGILVAGDGVENASIDGALRAGRRAAEAILA